MRLIQSTILIESNIARFWQNYSFVISTKLAYLLSMQLMILKRQKKKIYATLIVIFKASFRAFAFGAACFWSNFRKNLLNGFWMLQNNNQLNNTCDVNAIFYFLYE